MLWLCRDRQQSSPTRIRAEHSQLLDRNLVESALSRSLDFASLDELDPSLGMSAVISDSIRFRPCMLFSCNLRPDTIFSTCKLPISWGWELDLADCCN